MTRSRSNLFPVPTDGPAVEGGFAITPENMTGPDGLPLALLDLEASGLGPGTWPIEAAWTVGADAPSSVLIRPHESWSMAGWDPAAEALHGLTADQLKRTGAPVEDVCDAMNAALDGRKVYTDAPDHDGWWLHVMFSTARRRMAFTLHYLGDVLNALAAPEDIPAIVEEAGRYAPHTHRAAQDVRHMQWLVALARRRISRPV